MILLTWVSVYNYHGIYSALQKVDIKDLHGYGNVSVMQTDSCIVHLDDNLLLCLRATLLLGLQQGSLDDYLYCCCPQCSFVIVW